MKDTDRMPLTNWEAQNGDGGLVGWNSMHVMHVYDDVPRYYQLAVGQVDMHFLYFDFDSIWELIL